MPAAALVPHQTPASPPSQITTADPEKIGSRSPEASATGATRDSSPEPAHRSKAAGPTSTPSPSAPISASNVPHTSKTSSEPQKAQHAKILPQLNGWQARMSSEVASEMQVSSEKAKDSSIQDSFNDGSSISPPKPEASGESIDAIQPSKVSSDQKSDQKDTLSRNSATSDPLPTFEGHHEEGATRPSTRTAQTPFPEDDPYRAGASFIPDPSPNPSNLGQENKHPQDPGTAEAGSLQFDGQSNGDISTADSKPPDSSKGNPNGPPARVINNSPTDPAAVANAAGDPGLGSVTAPSSPSLHHDASPDDQGNPYPQPRTSPLPSNADDGSAPTPPSASNPLLQPPSPETPPASVPSDLIPTAPQSDASSSTAASSSASMKGTDPGSSGLGLSPLIDDHSQTQSPAPALSHNQKGAAQAQAQAAAQVQGAFQPPSNNSILNSNPDPNTNITSTASGRRGVGAAAQPSSSSPSRGGGNSDGNTSSVLPFHNGGEGRRIGVATWIVGLVGCAGAVSPLYFI